MTVASTFMVFSEKVWNHFTYRKYIVSYTVMLKQQYSFHVKLCLSCGSNIVSNIVSVLFFFL